MSRSFRASNKKPQRNATQLASAARYVALAPSAHALIFYTWKLCMWISFVSFFAMVLWVWTTIMPVLRLVCFYDKQIQYTVTCVNWVMTYIKITLKRLQNKGLILLQRIVETTSSEVHTYLIQIRVYIMLMFTLSCMLVDIFSY